MVEISLVLLAAEGLNLEASVSVIFTSGKLSPWAVVGRAYPEMYVFPGLFCTLWLLLNGVDAGKVIYGTKWECCEEGVYFVRHYGLTEE